MNRSSVPLLLIVVTDSLRPDCIHPDDMPFLASLRAEGTTFVNAYSVVPSLTRPNAASLVTGVLPGKHGIVGNQFMTADGGFVHSGYAHELEHLLTANGGLYGRPTMPELFARAGRRSVIVSTMSSGGTAILDPGVGRNGVQTIGLRRTGGERLIPDVPADLRSHLGPPPANPDDDRLEAIGYSSKLVQTLLEREPHVDLLLWWITEPDHTQHEHGSGSPEFRRVLRGVDAHVSAVVDAASRRRPVRVLHTADHGASALAGTADPTQAFAAAFGDEASIIAESPAAVTIRAGSDIRPRALADWLEAQPWAGARFVADRHLSESDAWARWLPLSVLGCVHPDRPIDMLVFPQWTTAVNAFGISGATAATGLKKHSSHGSLNPVDMRIPLTLWGDGIAARTVHDPAGIVDVAPTALSLAGLEIPEWFDGRPLFDESGRWIPTETPTAVNLLTSSDPDAPTSIESVLCGGTRYVREGWSHG